MQLRKVVLLTFVLVASASPALASTHPRRGAVPSKVRGHHAAKPKLIGQRGIDDQRATELQSALIHSGYLTGQPSGHWDEKTTAAMAKLQADNGWQTKLVPDSRAIIKLGLGPGNGTDSAGSGATAPASRQ